ncbi:MAG: NAD-dependent succinate-semialdehyde dehydrogenase [Bacteroidetes bacterium]|nr:MAG: NAD-dependent succinate-semialdehyde dehydrogenase [Bacteroidota bacterium]
MQLKSINPATGELLNSYPVHSPEEVSARLAQAESAWKSWRRLSFEERARPMLRLAELLRERRQELGRTITLEMGKPIREAVAEVEKCAWVCEHYAEHAAAFLQDEPAATDASESFVTFQPLGPVLAVMPWNFPFWQVFRFAAPALMAGNVGLLKHASNVSGCALQMEALFREAGFPEGAFAALLIPASRVAELIARPEVKAVTLTGSTEAGRAVAEAAGRHLKKTVLELGGSDPYVVLEDADLELAAQVCVQSRLINTGQSCIAAKRFIVVEAVFEPFTERVLTRLKQIRLGDPLNPETDIGPLARFDLRDELHRQVEESLRAGARCLLGGKPPTELPGAFYPPTLLTEVRPGMPAFDEELFGPVAALIRARDETEALQLANQSPFGLGAAVFTRDPERGRRIARNELEAGNCFVNGLVKSDPRLPFGGIKASGYGRELGRYGILEFVNVKSVWMR